ncbi:helix-turn-helix transcriptional regulator [Bacillus inaquosorum]|uniref:helix-turn-helix transcriptional regulator n=1 Tax=Bacillus inaquosorum TaxID=483913 RepID=UPI00228288FD|nr:YafY family protein [Bacillus inaquosorum]MCY7900593.1 YafY family transcriptional regulator [Bacillus inaquosorum]MCY8264381.1 YafY family transcriptional regulator [Bacillus inaquosorum]MCY8285157.1 YafY family transcriptional regulator [Bacillus inaquosorum]MCY9456536.1 YafY family transcriptional regulator [Bacillus inaquosorum]
MKLERLLAIVVLLISKKQVQAAELAELFEVSVRTIYRDIDTINRAGIPIVTSQGAGGGIGIIETYRLEREWLKEEELFAIASALQSVSSMCDPASHSTAYQKIKHLIPEQSAEAFKHQTEKWFIDMTAWGHTEDQKALREKISAAIDQLSTISFTYTNASGETLLRETEPYTLVCKAGHWYLYAYCLVRNDFRFFKLNRIKDMTILQNSFIRKDIQLDTLPWDRNWYEKDRLTELVILVQQPARQRIREWFGSEVLHCDEDENCRAVISLPEDQWLIGFLLQFGKDIEVLEPLHIRDKVKDTIHQMQKVYET